MSCEERFRGSSFCCLTNILDSVVNSRADCLGRRPARVTIRTDWLVATRDGLRHFVRIQRGDWIRRILKIWHQVVGGTAREAFDVRILHDRLVEVDEYLAKERRDSAVILTRILAGR